MAASGSTPMTSAITLRKRGFGPVPVRTGSWRRPKPVGPMWKAGRPPRCAQLTGSSGKALARQSPAVVSVAVLPIGGRYPDAYDERRFQEIQDPLGVK